MSNMHQIERVRSAVSKTVKLLARDRVTVRQQGHVPHVAYRPDGTVEYVNLPTIPDDPPEDFLLAVQGFLDHEVAHVLFSRPKEMREWFERAQSEGLPIELMKSFENAFEDVRIEREMSRQFQGSAYNLSLSLKFVLDRRVKPALDQLRRTVSDPKMLAIMTVPTCFMPYTRARSGSLEAREFMDAEGLWEAFEVIDRAFPNFQERLDALSSSGDAAALAYEFTKAVMPPPPGRGESDEDPEESDGGGKGEDKDKVGEGAGGSEEESESEKHEADDDAPEDDTPDDHEVEPPPFGDEDEAEDDEADEDRDDDADEDGDDDGQDEDEDSPDEEDAETDDGNGDGKKKNMSLTAAMKRLDPDQRRALFLYNNKRKTLRAVAETMKVTESKVSDLMKSGRRRLKELMGK